MPITSTVFEIVSYKNVDFQNGPWRTWGRLIHPLGYGPDNAHQEHTREYLYMYTFRSLHCQHLCISAGVIVGRRYWRHANMSSLCHMSAAVLRDFLSTVWNSNQQSNHQMLWYIKYIQWMHTKFQNLQKCTYIRFWQIIRSEQFLIVCLSMCRDVTGPLRHHVIVMSTMCAAVWSTVMPFYHHNPQTIIVFMMCCCWSSCNAGNTFRLLSMHMPSHWREYMSSHLT